MVKKSCCLIILLCGALALLLTGCAGREGKARAAYIRLWEQEAVECARCFPPSQAHAMKRPLHSYAKIAGNRPCAASLRQVTS